MTEKGVVDMPRSRFGSGSSTGPYSTSGPTAGSPFSAGDIRARKEAIEGPARQRESRGEDGQVSLTALLNSYYGGGGGGGGGGGRAKGPTIDLDPYKNKELEAMRELLNQQTAATRTELSGERARVGSAFERFQALRNQKMREDLRLGRGEKSRRGILDSGLFAKDQARTSTLATEEIGAEDLRSAALVNALSAQIGGSFDYLGRGEQDYGIGSLEAGRSAQEASQAAQIERAYLNARISQGGG